MFRLFVDEVGHHDMKSSADPNQRYLGLTGVVMRLGYADGEFTARLNVLKKEIFGRADFTLHRREIIDAKPNPFTALANPECRKLFDDAVLKLLETSTYRVFTVVIDKKEHKTKYSVWQFQPYHYCLTVMLERYALWLKRASARGDIMAESRGKKENKQLSRAYRWLYKNGTSHVSSVLFQQTLTSGEIKIKSKADNVSGLQFADMIAHPSYRELICRHTNCEMTAGFGRKVVDILYRRKYLRNPIDRTVQGWGTKWLP